MEKMQENEKINLDEESTEYLEEVKSIINSKFSEFK